MKSHSLKKAVFLLGLLTILTNQALASAETKHGTVVRVIDGDSLVLKTDNGPLAIRLRDIDCPELDQPYGRESKNATGMLLLNVKVSAEIYDRDRYNRDLAVVTLPDGRVANAELIRNGSCWVYPKAINPSLHKLETEARRLSIGLWANSAPMPPWEFRKSQRLKDVGMPLTVAVWKKLSKRERVLYLSGVIDMSGQEINEVEDRGALIGSILAALDEYTQNHSDQAEPLRPILKDLL